MASRGVPVGEPLHLATVTNLWIEASVELVRRLDADLLAIRDAFHASCSLGPVVDIRSGLSDPHNGGRTVLRLTFAHGLKLGYKPKDLGLDVAWRQLLRWLEDYGAPPSAQAPDIIARRGYGWVEWIESEPCASSVEAQRFFHRAGALLCLIQSLEGVDFHFENVIARGEYPVPVDLETLMHPRLPDPDAMTAPKTAAAVASERLRQSVLATSYLPSWVVLPRGHVSAIGGLSPAEVQDVQDWGFRHVNTDGMTFERISVPRDRATHLPTLEGKPLSSVVYRNEIMTGYAAMYRFLMDHQMALLDAGGPFAAFGGQTARVVLWPTQLYRLLLQRSLKTQNLSNGVDWTLHFDFLRRLYKLDQQSENVQVIQKMERRSLSNLDIPVFTSFSDEPDLHLSDGTVIEQYFERSSFEQLKRQLRNVSETTLKRELHFIDQTLRIADDKPVPGQPQPWQISIESGTGPTFLTSDVAIAEARLFAVALHRQAIREGSGAAWIGAVPLPGEEWAQLQVISHDMYAGTSGIALFLSALYRLTGEPCDRELALAAFEPFPTS